MYWKITILQDTYVDTVENKVKMRNQGSVKQIVSKQTSKGPLT
jgi:hypothetical protein